MRMRSLRSRVWEKSGGICFLCGLWMPPPNVDMGEPLRYTIEHVIPKSLGGTNELDNLEGTHQWCNNWKQDGLMEELPSGFKKVLRWKIKNLLVHQKVV